MFDATKLIRAHIAAMEPYQPIFPFEVLSERLGKSPEEIVKLDANENPYGPHPAVLEALGRIAFPHIYPDPECTQLRRALSKHTGVPFENLLMGAGADELLGSIRPGQSARTYFWPDEPKEEYVGYELKLIVTKAGQIEEHLIDDYVMGGIGARNTVIFKSDGTADIFEPRD